MPIQCKRCGQKILPSKERYCAHCNATIPLWTKLEVSLTKKLLGRDLERELASEPQEGRDTPRAKDPGIGDFFMPIKDVMSMGERGIVVTGKIERGHVDVDDTLSFLSGNNQWGRCRVKMIEMPDKKGEGRQTVLDMAYSGQEVGLLVEGVKEGELKPGMSLTKNVADI